MYVAILPQLSVSSELGQKWEALVQANPAGGVMQSLAWGQFKQQRGLNVVHFGLFAATDQLIGGMLCTIPAQSGVGSNLIAADGPILPWHDQALARQGLRLLREAAEHHASAYGAVGLRIEPRLERPASNLLRDWRRAPVDMLARETLYLDLRPSAEQLLAAMKPKGRYNIRLAARRGVTVRISHDLADIPLFYRLMDEAGERDDFYVEPIDHFNDLLATLAPLGYAHLLFAEYAGQTLGTLLLITYGQRAVYQYGGISNQLREQMAGYALQWAAIQQAQRLGCTSYDFYGFEPTGDPHHPFAGFSRFKRAFGGQAIALIGAYDYYFTEQLADVIIRAVRELA
ncbi:MAG TPA: peptidoglycan bridge formation glycyltransferase FemA/FemB family protein [Herpetosiphon sp.]|uniref:Methicillin resistance protein n=1 Tax=Herpetosiphon aurantiacus (strain ATCC 23779 / DSM 785 / 114-95) TaxID=316274 RepID=A9B2P5_HERA2|nr:peptidoglycan bridge formation glycyltransferase FemA/FemB family protein [Herpetosiphon sp.]ABX05496.1 Methicillin resistance protein [Herpetosiphon aurantiacus DSM 785]HBW52878.1 peptidoglycan bridge formation glycyltransferase FemA/FemB family protein [Herpetosiphon sp.]